METSRILRIKREPNWLGDFRIDYDGKYIGLKGKDKNYPIWWHEPNEHEPTEYEEMSFGGAFAEGRKLSPFITDETPNFIYIDIGDDRESLAWTKLVDDDKYLKVFDPDYF